MLSRVEGFSLVESRRDAGNVGAHIPAALLMLLQRDAE